jgi:uncharacterized protein YbjQ (UPF0145 family)
VRAPVDVAARQSKAPILVTTTNTVQDRTILEYLGVVSGEAIIGANILRDLAASVTDVVGGRSGAYEEVFRDARHIAVEEMSDAARVLGANAVLAVSLDYESLREGNMIMVAASGTAVRCQEPDRGGAAGGAGG